MQTQSRCRWKNQFFSKTIYSTKIALMGVKDSPIQNGRLRVKKQTKLRQTHRHEPGPELDVDTPKKDK